MATSFQTQRVTAVDLKARGIDGEVEAIDSARDSQTAPSMTYLGEAVELGRESLITWPCDGQDQPL